MILEGLGNFEAYQVMQMQVNGLLNEATTRTLTKSLPTTRNRRDGRLVLEALQILDTVGPDDSAYEHLMLGIGLAGEKPLASILTEVNSGRISYNLKDPLRLQDLINQDVGLVSSVIDPQWFLEPLTGDSDLELVFGMPHAPSHRKVGLVYEGDFQDSGIGDLFVDTTRELVDMDRVETQITQSLLWNGIDDYLRISHQTSQYEVDDEPYRKVTKLTYRGNDLDFYVESKKPSARLTQGHTSVSVTPKRARLTTGNHGYITEYDASNAEHPKVRTITFSQPHPANKPAIKDPINFSLSAITNKLSVILLDIAEEVALAD